MVLIKRKSQFSNPAITIFVSVKHTTMKDEILEMEKFVSVFPLYSYLIFKCSPSTHTVQLQVHTWPHGLLGCSPLCRLHIMVHQGRIIAVKGAFMSTY